MKIENIHIDGFGVWHDKSWEGLTPGLNVFHGPNETGKSTFMAFIRSILFGFDRRGSVRRYEPLNGGAHGGWLDLVAAEKRLRIERKPGRHIRGTVFVHDADSTGSENDLTKLLGGTTRTLYHNVFAFGLEELEQFHTLQENEVATHISGAGLGVGAARWAAVQKDLEERQSALFLPRGQNSTINVAFKELESIRDDLERTQNVPQDYWAAHENRARVLAELAALEESIAELQKRVQHYDKRIKARPLADRRSKLEARLNELPPIEKFPDGAIERLELLEHQLHTQRSELTRKRNDLENRRLERIALQSVADPAEIACRTQVIQSLQNLLPRIDAARRIYSACLERRDAVGQEKSVLVANVEAIRPPSKPAFMMFLSLIWTGAVGLYWAGQPYLAACVLATSLIPLLWYRNRLKTAATLDQKLSQCAARFTACQKELKKTEDEARQIETDIRGLTGLSEVTQEDIDIRIADLAGMQKVGDDIRKIDDTISQCETEIRMIEHNIDEMTSRVAELLGEGNVATKAELIERSDIFKQRQQILHDIEKIPVEAMETGFLFDMRAEEDAALDTALRELGEAEQRLTVARHDAGRLDERIAIMEHSEERARALMRQEKVLAKIDMAADQWAVLTLCRTLLDETRRVYENERQPEVLRQASCFFGIMTESRYTRVFMPLDGAEIQVERADGARLSPQMLSRGTAEQLYLCMRLALVREYANHVEPLPVVFDDIFVNFDPERTRSSIKAIRELCSTHQILLFTCHPHLVDVAREVVPTARVFPLQ